MHGGSDFLFIKYVKIITSQLNNWHLCFSHCLVGDAEQKVYNAEKKNLITMCLRAFLFIFVFVENCVCCVIGEIEFVW
jgi:hypothetical protein